MKLEQLRYFQEAAKYQHVGRAGKSLHISPSAISFAISGLEEELQVSLFDRVGSRIHLSEAGKRLKVRAEALFDFVDQIRSEFVPGQDKGFVGDFKVGGSHFLCTHYLTATWNDFQKKNPGLIGEISPGRTIDVVRSVLSGSLDLGLCFSPQTHPDLQLREFYRGRLLLVVRKGHPTLKEAAKAKRNLARLSDFPAVIHKAAPGVDICEDHPEFSRRGIQCRIANYFESDDLAVTTIVSGDFWSLLPDIVVRRHQASLAEIPLPGDWNAPYSVSTVIRKSRKESPIVASFSEALAKAFDSR